MAAEAAGREPGMSSAALVAFLEMVERPAVVLEDRGAIVGFNTPFRDIARQQGLASPVLLNAVLDPQSCERLDLVRTREGGARIREQLQLKFKDGSPAPADVQVTATADGALLTLLVIDAVSADRAAASLRHDIAGPLTAIIGAAELLLIRGGDLPAEARDRLTAILGACGRISEVLHRRWADGRSVGRLSP